MTSTTDGKIYHNIICTCGKQNTAGICDHVKTPVFIEQMPPQRVDYTVPLGSPYSPSGSQKQESGE